MRACKRTFLRSCLALLFAAAPLLGQNQDSPTALGCPDDVTGYALSSDAILRKPFNLLGSLDSTLEAVRSELPRKGDPYSARAAIRGHDAIRDQLAKQGGNPRFRLRVQKTYYTRCDIVEKLLAVEYEIFVFSLEPPRLRLFESVKETPKDPSRTAQPGAAAQRLSVRPEISYDRADDLSVGASVGYALKNQVLSTIRGKIQKSSEMTTTGFNMEGSSNYWKWASSAHWKVAYDYFDQPAEDNKLRRSRGLAQFHAAFPAVWNESVVFRTGTSFELGNQQSDIQAAQATNTVASSAYSSWKVALGATGRTDKHALVATYGFQLGSISDNRLADYYKHIAEFGWDYRQPFGNHRTFEVELNVLLGKLKVPGKVPAAERFFGGGVALQPFLVADDWQIHAAPVLRSMPNRSLSHLTADQGIGGESYASLNLTIAPIVLWRTPLLPGDVGQDPEFRQALKRAKDEARTGMIPFYKGEAPRRDAEVEMLQQIRSLVPAVVAGIDSAKAAKPTLDWFDCRFIADAIDSTAEEYRAAGDLTAIGAAVDGAMTACGEGNKMTSAEISQMFGGVKSLSDKLATSFDARPDVQAKDREAKADFKIAARAVDVFVDQMNLFSISPLAIFDAASIGPQINSAGGGVHYGVGGGLRFGLVSHVNFDVGYVANPRRAAWEPKGALFFQMRFIELIR